MNGTRRVEDVLAEERRRKPVDPEVRRLRRQVGLLEEAVKAARSAKLPKPVPATARIRTRGDLVRVIVPDTHGSAADPLAIAALLADVKAQDPDEVVLMGDHVDCGGFLAQHHTLGYVAQTEYSYEEDILAANRFLDALQKAAPGARFHYVEGNHERRIETWAVTQTLRHSRDAEMLRRVFAPEFVLNLKARGIPYYRQSQCYGGVTLPGTIKLGKIYFTHGFSTAKHAAMAHLAKIGGNMVYAHTHRADSFVTELVHVGTVAAYSPGCLCVKQPLWRHTDPTGWTQGYGLELVDRRSGAFIHINVPIAKGQSLLRPLLGGVKPKGKRD